MKKQFDKPNVMQDLTVGISDSALERFRSFSNKVLGRDIDEAPTAEYVFMKQNLNIVFYATMLFILTNGFYLVKNVVLNTMITIDMIPLYMMVGSSLAMLIFLKFYKKYDSPVARFALLAYYLTVIASVTVFMVSCNYHKIGLSISMCYLFAIMIAPTYKLFDTIVVIVSITVSWWLPSVLPYAENYNLFKHFLLRFAIIIGFVVVRSIFIRQSANESHITEMSNSFIKLAYNDAMTGTLNKKALDAYRAYVVEKLKPEKISAIIYDIDDFKSFNDHFSHMKGDEALIAVSGNVVKILAKTDRYLFRFGGEEFVVILPDVDETEATAIAERLLGAVREANVKRTDLPDTDVVTASFGVACGTLNELNDLSVIAKADKQLYYCKQNGKNGVAAGNVIYR